MIPRFWLFVLSTVATALSAWDGLWVGMFILYLTNGALLLWHLRAFQPLYVPSAVWTSAWLCVLFWPWLALGRVWEWPRKRGKDYQRFSSSGSVESDVEMQFFPRQDGTMR